MRCSKQEVLGFVVSKLQQVTMKYLAKKKQIVGKARNQRVHQAIAPLCSTSRNAAVQPCPAPGGEHVHLLVGKQNPGSETTQSS